MEYLQNESILHYLQRNYRKLAVTISLLESRIERRVESRLGKLGPEEEMGLGIVLGLSALISPYRQAT